MLPLVAVASGSKAPIGVPPLRATREPVVDAANQPSKGCSLRSLDKAYNRCSAA
jgi:hypothetical protein